MRRRTFIQTAVGAAVVTAIPLTGLPLPAAPLSTPENYTCPCGLVQYFQKPEGHFAATHILMDGQRQRFTYGLFKRHEELHRKLGIGTGKLADRIKDLKR